MKGQKPLFSSKNDNWKTPQAFYKALDAEFRFDYDPCPSNPKDDGLKISWGQCNYVNPPYSETPKWLEKGWEEYKKGKTVVYLIPSRTDTKWWHKYCMKADEIRFIKGRLQFEGTKYSAPFPSCIVIFRNSL